MKHFTDALFEELAKVQDTNSTYYHIEVFNEDNEPQGGIFRGTNKLLKALYNTDDEHYDYVNEALYWLEIKTPFPDGLDDPKIKFAYKCEFYDKNIGLFKDFEAELNAVDWSMVINKFNRPEKIVYEDDTQIAYIG